jgi:hypothetical protein
MNNRRFELVFFLPAVPLYSFPLQPNIVRYTQRLFQLFFGM